MSTSPRPLSEAERAILQRTLRMNMRIMALIVGLLIGGALWFATAILLVKGGTVIGPHLSLLSIFMPGYSVTWSGSWIGLLWGFVYGAVIGGVMYGSYARSVAAHLEKHVIAPRPGSFRPPTFLISGNALGIGTGAAAALPLIWSTNWLVIRGTAAYSDNAALLSHYLPGYSVSIVGSLVGGAELFVLAYAASHLLAVVYNTVARARGA